ncbi:hypothetical protein L3X38_005816 [Prunus dulcis]|uniref:Uncharacterized protein n=1 Tax=Prunus dulcis TaxID=3755 RepID=A0AAD5F4H5_PRUDU|nr:hypothetical protein L3X38_005816 [Prunus dulcis]
MWRNLAKQMQFTESKLPLMVFLGFATTPKAMQAFAEAIASTDGEEDSSGSEEIQEMLEDLIRENNMVESHFKQPKRVVVVWE